MQTREYILARVFSLYFGSCVAVGWSLSHHQETSSFRTHPWHRLAFAVCVSVGKKWSEIQSKRPSQPRDLQLPQPGRHLLGAPIQLQRATVFGGKGKRVREKSIGMIWKTPLCLSGRQMDVAGDYQRQARSQRGGGGDSPGSGGHTVPCCSWHRHSWAQLAPLGCSICRAGAENWR